MSDPDAGDTFSYALTNGNTGGAFAIDASGQITVANPAALDFETVPGQAFTLEVTVTDQGGTGLASTATVTVNLTDVNEAPAVTGFTTSIAENSALGTVVGSVSVSDPDAGDTFSYAITNGNTGGAFAIDASGQITVANPAALDFETVPGQSFTLEVTVTDQGGAGLASTATVTVNLSDVNEAPSVTGFTTAIAENAALGTVVGSVSVSDPDAGDTFSYALTNGNTGGAFAIDASGQITVANPTALDFETVPGQAFTLEVTVTDQGGTGLASTATVTVNLTDVNEAPAVTGFTTSIAENSALGTVVGSVSVSDPDAGDTFSYALTNGNTTGAFAIDASGQITVANPAALDFETVPGQAFTLEVTVTDQGGTGLASTATVTVNLSDVNEAPSVTGFTTAIAENAALGTVVGSVSVSDPDAGDTFSYALTNGNTSGAFAIDASGQITVANPAALDFETVPGQAFTLEVTVTDQGGTGLANTATVTVNLTDVNEAPAVTGFTTSIAENSALGTVVGSVSVSDPDAGDTFSYALTNGNTAGAFAIDASGQITVANPAALDFETVPGQAFTLEVTVTDQGGAGLASAATVTVNLTDVNEAPAVTGFTTSIAENSALGTVVGSVSVSDPDAGDTFSYALTNGNTGGAFAIDANGQITVANPAALDFETVPGQAFTLEVTVTDQGGAGLASTATVTVNLTDVNEAPAVTGFTTSIAENSALGTVVGSVSVSDPDAGDTFSYALTNGNTGGAFAIDASGQITVANPAALDFETVPGQAFTLEVTVTDQGGTGLASTATVTVNLTDVNEAPAVTGFTTSIAENSALGTVVGSVSVSDPDAGDTFSYAITNGNTGGAFAIDASGQITVANPAALDFETVPGQSFTLEVTVTDQGGAGLASTATVTVNLSDVNEAPSVTGFTTAIAENSALGTVVGSVSVSDPDAGDTFSYALTNGNTAGAFAIDASGQITVANPAALDFETVPGQSFTLEVTVTDQGGAGLASTATVTVNLTDVNEAPAVTGFTTSIAENSALGTVVGSVSVSDPDAGDTFSYALTNGNTSGAFAIDASGQITVANPAALDFETVPGRASRSKSPSPTRAARASPARRRSP